MMAQSQEIDLGGRKVELRTLGLAHTRGDQVVWIPVERIVFTGDLVEERIFPIFPWFPPNDADLDAAALGADLDRARALECRRWWCPATAMSAAIGAHGRARLHGRSRPARRRSGGRPATHADKIVAELAPVIRAEHPDWMSPEWIDFAIRYYASHDYGRRPDDLAAAGDALRPEEDDGEHEERQDRVAQAGGRGDLVFPTVTPISA